ncbi:MAG: M20/M25/M40 family metallo-hydrolase, partial [Candidatus Latescibacteria bacterium]|nr:M20/M25/M40 family metallo-hydrolase [Candidatus Latescibacterota bacterium]
MARDVAIDAADLLDVLKRMIRIRSVLPHEQPLAEFIADELRKIGVEPEWDEVAPGRPNVYASADLGPRDRFLTLTGHTDTVGVARNWLTDPFDPVEQDGRLYGLGSVDMKAGLACALVAFKTLVESPECRGRLGRVGFAATVDEEGYGTGARALLKTEYAKSDGLLLGEPYYGDSDTGPIPLAMTGKVLYRLTVQGRAAHAFHPERGVNAVEDAGKILAALPRLRLGAHPLIGQGNYSTLKVDGGYREYAVVVPEHCEIIITRLTVPGETRETAIQDMHDLIASLDLPSRVTVETPPPYYDPFFLDQRTPLLAAFQEGYRTVLGRSPVLAGRRGIIDGNIYVTEGGIPTVTFGPAGAGLHEAGEYVEIATLEPVARV